MKRSKHGKLYDSILSKEYGTLYDPLLTWKQKLWYTVLVLVKYPKERLGW